MSTGRNQHFVPQYYFRLFSENSRTIHAFLKSPQEVRLDVPIRGQCARHRFYGSKQLESIFSDLENRHAEVVRRTREAAWNPDRLWPSTQGELLLRQAVLFQHARTPLSGDKQKEATETLFTEAFRSYVEKQDPHNHRIIEALRSGKARVQQNQRSAVLLMIKLAMQSLPLVSDLATLLIRNQSDQPFIFGDAPVVLYNTLQRDVTDRGVLGLQTPGLQIFMPLDPATMLMLYDPNAYSVVESEPPGADAVELSDISQLNALQLHHSSHAVYFSAEWQADYVMDLWNAHRSLLRPPRMKGRRRKDLLVDGKPPDGELWHFFEPQVNMTLDLGFVRSEEVSQETREATWRSKELVDEQKRIFPLPGDESPE